MEQVFGLLFQALAQIGWRDVLTAAGVYIATPLNVHMIAQFVKFNRRERAVRELTDTETRCMVFILGFTIALFIGWRLGDWPIDKAVDHAFAIAVFHPFAMWLYMAWLKKKDPDAHSALKVPRRRNCDE